jgi:hypothetical protein
MPPKSPGRPKAAHPRAVRVTVRLTAAEAEALQRRAGTGTLSDAVRQALRPWTQPPPRAEEDMYESVGMRATRLAATSPKPPPKRQWPRQEVPPGVRPSHLQEPAAAKVVVDLAAPAAPSSSEAFTARIAEACR